MINAYCNGKCVVYKSYHQSWVQCEIPEYLGNLMERFCLLLSVCYKNESLQENLKTSLTFEPFAQSREDNVALHLRQRTSLPILEILKTKLQTTILWYNLQRSDKRSIYYDFSAGQSKMHEWIKLQTRL